jgi:hypothetical protein
VLSLLRLNPATLAVSPRSPALGGENATAMPNGPSTSAMLMDDGADEDAVEDVGAVALPPATSLYLTGGLVMLRAS